MDSFKIIFGLVVTATTVVAHPQWNNRGQNALQGNTYGPPVTAYPPSGWKPDGPQFVLPNEEPKTTEKSEPVTEAPARLTSTSSNQNEETGQYYVLLPNGLIQKVRYNGRQRGRGQYEAQVEFEAVEPIRPPIYHTLPLEALF